MCIVGFEQTSEETILAVHLSAIFVLNRALCYRILNVTHTTQRNLKEVAEGLPSVLGNKGTLAKHRREQGNMSLFLRNRGKELYK